MDTDKDFSSQNDYYMLAGHLIGWTDGTSTTYDLTDAQGSVLTSFSKSAIQGADWQRRVAVR